MSLALAQRFGNDVQFDVVSKRLTIDLDDLSDFLDVSSITEDNIDSYAAKIIWALLQRQQQQQPDNNNDDTVSIYITNQGKRSVTRNGVSQFGFALVATAYRNDNLGISLDANQVGD